MRSQIMIDVLSGLRKALADQRDALDCTLARATMQHGLSKIPDEILAIILSLVDYNFETVVGLLGVCKRFKMVMLATPKVWANCIVSPDLYPKCAKTIIERSGRLPLICKIPRLLHSDSNCHAQDTILARRAWSLSLTYLYSAAVKNIHTEYRCLELPNLFHLTIKLVGSIQRAPSVPFYDTWRMPNLSLHQALEPNSRPVISNSPSRISI